MTDAAYERIKQQIERLSQRVPNGGSQGAFITRSRSASAGVKARVLVLGSSKSDPTSFGSVKVRFYVVITEIQSIVSHANRVGDEYILSACGKSKTARNEGASTTISMMDACEISALVPASDRFAQTPPTVGLYDTHLWFENNESKGVMYPAICCTVPFVEVVAMDGVCQMQCTYDVVEFLSLATGPRGLVRFISEDRIKSVSLENERRGEMRRHLKDLKALTPPPEKIAETQEAIKALEVLLAKPQYDTSTNRDRPYVLTIKQMAGLDPDAIFEANPTGRAYQLVVSASKGTETYAVVNDQQTWIKPVLLITIAQNVPDKDGEMDTKLVSAAVDMNRFELGPIFCLPIHEWEKKSDGLVNPNQLNDTKKFFARFLENYLHRMRVATLCTDDTTALTRNGIPSTNADYATALSARRIAVDVAGFVEAFGIRVTSDAVEALFEKFDASLKDPDVVCAICPEQRKYAYKTVTAVSSLINVGSFENFSARVKMWDNMEFYIVPNDPVKQERWVKAMQLVVTNTSAPIGREKLMDECENWDYKLCRETPSVQVFAVDRTKLNKAKELSKKIIDFIKTAISKQAAAPAVKRSVSDDEGSGDDAGNLSPHSKRQRIKEEYEDDESPDES